MKKIIVLFIVLLFGFHLHAEQLILNVKDAKSSQGKMMIMVYDKEDGFLSDTSKALQKLSVPVYKDNSAQISISGLKLGQSYSIVVYHDENNDSELNRSFVGIPKENVGFSNNPKLKFGPPKFKDTTFVLTKDKMDLTINLISY